MKSAPWRTEGARLLRVAMGEADACRKGFAAAIGVAPSYLSMLENGQRRPGLDLAAKIETATLGGIPMIAWTQPPRVESSQRVKSDDLNTDDQTVKFASGETR